MDYIIGAPLASNNHIETPADRLALGRLEFALDIIALFRSMSVMNGLHTVQTIESGTGDSFRVSGGAKAVNHKPGQNIYATENGIASQIPAINKVINIDDTLMACTFMDRLEEKMCNKDLRKSYTVELATALARQMDIDLLQAGINGARDPNPNIKHPGPGYPETYGGTRSYSKAAAQSPDALYEEIRRAAEIMDEHDVPKEERFVALRPRQYHMLCNLDARKYVEWSRPQFENAKLFQIAGISAVETNHLPKSGGTVALVWHPSAIGTVKLQDIAVEDERDFDRHGWKVKAFCAVGHGYLRPEALVEITTETDKEAK